MKIIATQYFPTNYLNLLSFSGTGHISVYTPIGVSADYFLRFRIQNHIRSENMGGRNMLFVYSE